MTAQKQHRMCPFETPRLLFAAVAVGLQVSGNGAMLNYRTCYRAWYLPKVGGTSVFLEKKPDVFRLYKCIIMQIRFF